MDDESTPRVYLAAPIGQPLPIKQPLASSADTEAWAINYGSMWPRTYGDPAPDPLQWRIERLERLGEGFVHHREGNVIFT